ncbi:hypothetical protein AAFF_G00256180, partial [Aldrovandia affinis]
MSTYHLKLNLGKTELLFLPVKGSPMIDASITVESSIVSPSQSARSLGVTLDDQLCFSGHIAAITQTCQFSLHNIRRIIPNPRGHTETAKLFNVSREKIMMAYAKQGKNASGKRSSGRKSKLTDRNRWTLLTTKQPQIL